MVGRENRERLHKFIWGLLNAKKCFSFQVGGVDNHIHIIFSLHPSIALSTLVKDIKVSSSNFIKENQLFPKFSYWQEGFGAFTYSLEARTNLIAYVQNQEEHHKQTSSKEEIRKMLTENEIEYIEKYL